jgi:hypothetical protein
MAGCYEHSHDPLSSIRSKFLGEVNDCHLLWKNPVPGR